MHYFKNFIVLLLKYIILLLSNKIKKNYDIELNSIYKLCLFPVLFHEGEKKPEKHNREKRCKKTTEEAILEHPEIWSLNEK